MSNEIKIEDVKIGNSASEWKSQHRQRTKKAFCAHLRGVYQSRKLEADREGEAPYWQPIARCKICNKELQEWDLKKIQQTLEKFKNLKK